MFLAAFRRHAGVFAPLAAMGSLLVFMLLVGHVQADSLDVGEGKTYGTIQEAVNVAVDGDVVNVYPGTYNESVDLSSMDPDGDITIRSVDNSGDPATGQAVVNGGSWAAFKTSVTPFRGDVTIQGFTVTSALENGIYLMVNSDIQVLSVTASGTGDDGIDIEGASGNVVVSDCTANGTGEEGIDILGVGGTVTVTHCTVNDNASSGIYIEDVGGDVHVEECEANLNGSDAISVHDVDGSLEVLDSTAKWSEEDGMELGAGDGIDGSVVISNCIANGNWDDGIDVDDIGADVHVVSMTASFNGDGDEHEDGMEIGDVSGIGGKVRIDGCQAMDNDDDGVDIGQAAGGVVITDCHASDNFEEGITLWSIGGDVSISGCTANRNAGGDDEDGITMWVVGGDVVARDGTTNENGDDGLDIDLVDGSVTVLNWTSLDNVAESGIDLEVITGTVLISGCVSNGNGVGSFADDEDGVHVQGYDDVHIRDCVTIGNGEDGIDVEWESYQEPYRRADNVRISSVLVRDNADDGLEINADGDVTITHVTLINNTDDGIELDTWFEQPNASNVTVRNSRIQGSLGGLWFDWLHPNGSQVVTGNIICDNPWAGLYLSPTLAVNAGGNWWGSTSGPHHDPANLLGTGDIISGQVALVDFAPWIETVTVTPNLETAQIGVPMQLTLQFSDKAKTVFLGQGPGYLGDTPPFTVTTNNGVLTGSAETGTTIHEFISLTDGAFAVTLLPDSQRAVILDVEGPCGLLGRLGGLHVYLPVIVRKP